MSMIDLQNFNFTTNLGEYSYCGNIKAGITSKKELLEKIALELHFPDYYGVNWDALEECLHDLEWVPKGRIVINHADLPLGQNKNELHTYLEILSESVDFFKNHKDRSLAIYFPINSKEILSGMK